MLVKKKLFNLLYFVPLLTFYLVFIFLPISSTIHLSFHQKLFSGSLKFVGLKNYINFFQASTLLPIFKNTALWVFITLFFKILLGFITALLLDREFAWKKIFSIIILLPWVSTRVATSVVWKWIYNSTYGHINGLLLLLGIINNPVNWLGDPSIALFSVMFINIWISFPFDALLILSSLTSIPKEIYEAARIDGASKAQCFVRITLPLIMPFIILLIMLEIIWGFNDFGTIFVTTSGGPGKATEILITSVFRTAFIENNFGNAAALSVIGVFLLIFVSSLYLIIKKRLRVYQ